MPPYWRALYADIKFRNLKSARNYLIRADRLCKPLWSHAYIESGTFGGSTSDMMKGMNYHVALLADKVVLGGLEKLVNKHFKGKPMDHYLLKKELKDMFKVNEGKHLWDAEMVSEREHRRTFEEVVEEGAAGFDCENAQGTSLGVAAQSEWQNRKVFLMSCGGPVVATAGGGGGPVAAAAAGGTVVLAAAAAAAAAGGVASALR